MLPGDRAGRRWGGVCYLPEKRCSRNLVHGERIGSPTANGRYGDCHPLLLLLLKKNGGREPATTSEEAQGAEEGEGAGAGAGERAGAGAGRKLEREGAGGKHTGVVSRGFLTALARPEALLDIRCT